MSASQRPPIDDPERKDRSANQRSSSARVRGRHAAMALYYGLATAVCIVAAVQVVRQIFAHGPPSPYATCTEGLRALATSLDRARRAAAEQADPSSFETPGDEDAALARFRAALEPEWGYRDGVAATCRGRTADERALDAIERLRYAEEHAVRREAEDLAPLRRQVRAIVAGDLARAGGVNGGDSPLPERPPAGEPAAVSSAGSAGSAALPPSHPTGIRRP